MIRGERLGRPRRSARRGSIDWYMGTYDGYMEQCSIPSRFLLDSLGALELVCIGHRPCAPPPAAWPFARGFWEGFHRFCAVRCLAEHVHTRVGLQFWFVIFEVTFTQSRSTICITSHVLEISSRESSAVFIKPPILANSRSASRVPRFITVDCARGARARRARVHDRPGRRWR
jgi:hypothetical protein